MNPNCSKGIYTLLLYLPEDTVQEVGKLGVLHLPCGYYTYTGSARGSGGFKRIKRHIEVSCGRNKTRKWHIDYLLPITSFLSAVASVTDHDIECAVARGIGTVCEPISGFGCTDCSCESHLHFSRDFELIRDAVMRAHERVHASGLSTSVSEYPLGET